MFLTQRRKGGEEEIGRRRRWRCLNVECLNRRWEIGRSREAEMVNRGAICPEGVTQLGARLRQAYGGQARWANEEQIGVRWAAGDDINAETQRC